MHEPVSFELLTGADGRLVDTSLKDLDAFLLGLREAQHLVLHFHGGLVKQSAGEAIAKRLGKSYAEAGADSLFFVWKSGLVEQIKGNCREIFDEEFFQKLLKEVCRYAVGKLKQAAFGKSIGLAPVTDEELYSEQGLGQIYQATAGGPEAFAELVEQAERSTLADQDLEPAEQQRFEDDLQADSQLADIVLAIELHEQITTRDQHARAVSGAVVPKKSRLDPEILESMRQVTQGSRAKGLAPGLGFLIGKAGAVLYHVVRRLLNGRHHGLYATAVEEILHAFYAAFLGAKLWEAMKNDTRDTFQEDPDGLPRGGRVFVERLGRLLVQCPDLPVTLVGHSTGAVFINRLLEYVDQCRRATPPAFPDTFRFRNLVFLAPACRFEDFAPVVQDLGPDGTRPLFQHFRMFAMDDATELGDHLVPYIPVYPHSLLYFVSGALERDGQNPVRDAPIVGMQRYYQRLKRNGDLLYDAPPVGIVRKFVQQDAKRAVWSVTTTTADGLQSQARSHGACDDEPETVKSLQHLIAKGY